MSSLLRGEQESWSKLVGYLLSCVVREAQVEPVALYDHHRWAVLPLPSETVLCGDALTVALSPGLQELFAGLDDMEGVFYGWPTVVVEDERGKPFVAPLFVRALEEPVLGGDSDSNPLVPISEMLPQVNTSLLSRTGVPPEVLAEVAAIVGRGAIGFGEAPAVTHLAQELIDAIGLTGDALDPGSLGAPSRPQEVGVFNLVMAFKGELNDMTRGLVNDLEWMQDARDWPDSAARYLLQQADVPAPSRPKSCAVQLNSSQEAALASAATAPLTVITGPPGTGKSQVVSAIVADAWLRGESVVVASTNNAPIDSVINDKMHEIDDGLILRTGNSEKRQELAAGLGDLMQNVLERPFEDDKDTLPYDTMVRHQAARLLADRAGVEQAVYETAMSRDHTRAQVWGDQQEPRADWRTVRPLAERACRTWWGWLRRRRASKSLHRAGLHDTPVTIEQLRDWAVAEANFAAAWKRHLDFQQANPGDALVSFIQADARWRQASTTAIRTRVQQAFVDGRQVLEES